MGCVKIVERNLKMLTRGRIKESHKFIDSTHRHLENALWNLPAIGVLPIILHYQCILKDKGGSRLVFGFILL
jgi:hypothetical protein